jgi:pimeloyl-ACP methyl ester carboxylesterase
VDARITPFRVEVPDAVLDDLRARLERTRLPGSVAGAGWDYGTEPGFLAELIEHWRTRFDWRAVERDLNERMPQFTADLDGQRVHFAHVRGRGPNPVPLLFSHGWPGTFHEANKIIGPLTDPAAHGGDPADAFDVIAPSLPGYGFSPDPEVRGVNPGWIAELYASLMDALGYRRYGLQGGDWGSLVTSRLAFARPDRVAGLHLNMAGLRPNTDPGSPPLTEAEQAFVAEMADWRAREGGYQAIQSTKPQTLAYALNDSPAGLAAWIVEKYRAWTDCGGDVASVLSLDELLTTITIYWVSGSIGSSVRLYYEAPRDGWRLPLGERVEVPTAFAKLPGEISRPPREWVERSYRLERWTEFPSGGHFAALEQPFALVDDLREFFRPLRSSF